MAGNNATVQDSLLRSGGQLYSSPTSPATGKMVGDNPDQAKMRGTPAQKTPVIKEAMQPQAVPPPVQPMVSPPLQSQAAAKQSAASDLSKFTGYNDILQTIAQKKYAQVLGQPVGLKPADAATLNQYFASDAVVGGKPVSQYLNEYSLALQNPQLTPDQKQRPLVALSKAMSASGTYVDPTLLNSWYSGVKDTLADTAAERVNNNVIMGDFTVEDYDKLGIQGGRDRVAQLLGVTPTQLQTMTLTEFQDAIDQKQRQEYSQVDQLKNELAQAPAGSDYARQIQDQIKALSGAGIATTEQRFKEAANAIRERDEVVIAGQKASIQDLLSDQAVSDAVSRYLDATPEQRKNFLPPGYEQFTAWINANEQSLATLNDQLKAQATKYSTAQEKAAGLQTKYSGASDEVLKVLGGGNPPKEGESTPSDVQTFINTVNSTGAGKILGDPTKYGFTADEGVRISDAINRNIKKIKDWDENTIIERYKMAQELQDPTSTLSLLSDIKGDFVKDSDVKHFNYLKTAAKYLDKLNSTDREAVLGTDTVVKMIKRGELTPQLVKQAADHIKDYNLSKDAAQAFKDLGTDELISNYKMVSKLASFGDPGSIKLLKRYQEIDTNNDGTFSEKEVKAATKMPSLKDFVLGDGQDLTGLRDIRAPKAPKAGTPYATLLNMSRDSKITPEEATLFWKTFDQLDMPKDQIAAIKKVLPESYKSTKDVKTVEKKDDTKLYDKAGLQLANTIFQTIGTNLQIPNITQYGSNIPDNRVPEALSAIDEQIAEYSKKRYKKDPIVPPMLERLNRLKTNLNTRVADLKSRAEADARIGYMNPELQQWLDPKYHALLSEEGGEEIPNAYQ